MSEAKEGGAPAGGAEVSIVRVRVSELEEFARRTGEEGRDGGVVAISPERARSQARNPWARPDDVALLAAYVDGRCEGYMGLMPGRLYDRGRDRPITWMTTWYVSPRVRGIKLGYRLLAAAFDEAEALFTTVFTEAAARVFRTSMHEMQPLAYRIVDFRHAVPWSLVLRRLVRGGPDSGLLRRAERGVFRPARATVLALLSARYARAAARLRARPVEQLDDADFAPLPPDAARFVRGAAVVNWMLRYPWVVEAPAPPDDDWREYFFSRTRPLFRYVAYRFTTEQGERAGFAVLAVTEDRGSRAVRLLDHELRAPADADGLLGLLLREARRWSADALVLPASMDAALRGPVWRLLVRRPARPYFVKLRDPDGDLAATLHTIQLDRCDSDVAFV